MSIQERIKQYLNYKEITPYKFCKDLGLSMGYLDKKGSIGTDKYLKIIEYFPDISPDWLLTGNGEMIKSNEKITNQSIVGDKNVQAGVNSNINNSPDFLQAEIKELHRLLSEKDAQINKLLTILSNH